MALTESVYAVLRSAMIDRDRDETEAIESAKLVTLGPNRAVALRDPIPSTAFFLAYSMLYFPEWLNDEEKVAGYDIRAFIGGSKNPKFPVFALPQNAMIALAIGCMTNLFLVHYSEIQDTFIVYPNLGNGLVAETKRIIRENKLTLKDAREALITLLKMDEYAGLVSLADDNIADLDFEIQGQATTEVLQ